MENIADPMLAHETKVLKLLRESLFPRPLSDCCRSAVIEVNDFDVCSCCLRYCTRTPA